MPTVRWGCGGLPTLVLCLPLSPDCVEGDGSRPPRGELGGGILAVSRQQYISSRRWVANYFCHIVVHLDPYKRGHIQGPCPIRWCYSAQREGVCIFLAPRCPRPLEFWTLVAHDLSSSSLIQWQQGGTVFGVPFSLWFKKKIKLFKGLW